MAMGRKTLIHLVWIWVLMPALTTSCSPGNPDTHTISDPAPRLPDTLRVATLYSPTSYFLYRGEAMGYDHDLVAAFADSMGMVLDLRVMPSLERAVAMLDSGLVDLIAYEVPVTGDFMGKVHACGPRTTATQVLVQRTGDGNPPVTDVTQLVGRKVWVEPASKYQYRLENLNEELGGGIDIALIDRDTLIAEDALEMVSRGEIDLAVVDSEVARLNSTYYTNIDASLEISFGQRAQWGVSARQAWLGDSIDAWMARETTRQRNDMILKRYFELAKNTPLYEFDVDFNAGRLSPYDALFRKYAASIGWDWRLLAAQGYVESKFRNDVTSWAGARGLMQIMPGTARAYGASPDALVNPETSIRIAANIIKALDTAFKPYVADPAERRKFVIAAYNSGNAHIYDAIALARKYGRDPARWDANVADALLLKGDPQYYRDPVVKYGYFRGRQTFEYVNHVMDFYNRAKQHFPQ